MATNAPTFTPPPKVFTTAELIALGGKFYNMGGTAYCDTPLETYRLVPDYGWVLA